MAAFAFSLYSLNGGNVEVTELTLPNCQCPFLGGNRLSGFLVPYRFGVWYQVWVNTIYITFHITFHLVTFHRRALVNTAVLLKLDKTNKCSTGLSG